MEKPYDLEERTFLFAKECRIYIQKLPKTISNIEDGKQLVRSSGSVGANYIEASDDLEKADENMKTKLHEEKRKNLSSLAFLLTPPFSLVPSLYLVPCILCLFSLLVGFHADSSPLQNCRPSG